MRGLQIKFNLFLILILIQTNGVSADKPLKMVTYDGIAKYADRFEFLPSDDANHLKCDPGEEFWRKKVMPWLQMT